LQFLGDMFLSVLLNRFKLDSLLEPDPFYQDIGCRGKGVINLDFYLIVNHLIYMEKLL